MTWITTATSTDERDRGADVAVLPVGSFEQHSSFLPLSTDTLVACSIASRIAEDYNLFLLPPITMSCSHEHTGFAGTVSISARTLYALLEDISNSLRASGVDKLVVVNGHGGNYVLSNVVQEANAAETRMTLFPNRTDWDTARKEGKLETSHSRDMHAGEMETSLLLYSWPEVVGEDYQTGDLDVYPRSHLLVTGMREYTNSGVLGFPSLGTPEKGQALLESISRCFAHHLALLA